MTNNGNKLMVDGTGSSIVVRCPNLADSANCMDYDSGKGQLTPAPSSTPGQPNFMTPAQLAAVQDPRQGRGHLLPRLPAGQRREAHRWVVWVESCTTSYANIGPVLERRASSRPA